MPRGASYQTEQEAIALVRQEEVENGWTPGPLLDQQAQRREGCDFFSAPSDGGPSDAVEVKGWGEPLLDDGGRFTYPADVRKEQFDRARGDSPWRLEIVANLTAAREGRGRPQRLTLTGQEVVKRAKPALFKLPLDDFRERIREV